MKKIFKWAPLFIAILVILSLVFYVKEKKNRPVVSSDELLRLALVEIREHKNYRKAIMLTQQALAASPDYTDVQLTLARAYMLNDNLDSAQWHLKNLLTKDKKNGQGLLYLVNISMLKKDTVSALAYLDHYVGYYPEERETYLKDYALLLQHKDYNKADTVFNRYIRRFKRDSIQTAGFDYWLSKGRNERSTGDFSSAYRSYQKASGYQKNDTAVLQQLVNLSLYFNNNIFALKYNDELLKQYPSNKQYLITASAIYKNLGDNENAVLSAENLYQSDPSNRVAKENLAALYLSLAKEGTTVNRIHYATSVLQLLPAQKEALLYLINGYLDMHQYASALEINNRALQYYPNDQPFILKKIGILYDSGNYLACMDYIESVLTRQTGIQYIKAYNEAALKLSADLIKQKKWADALLVIQKALAYSRNDKSLLEELVNVYGSLNNTTAALGTIDQLLLSDPGNETYLFKKSGLLETQHAYEEAAAISGALYKKHPAVMLYKQAYLDQLVAAERSAAMQQDWNKAIHFYRLATATETPGYFQLLYALAAYNGKKDTLHVLALTDTALNYFPNDSLLLVKRSLAYGSVWLYPQALGVSRSLLEKYPSDTALQAVYLDQLYAAGKYYEKENKNDSAIRIFLTGYAAAPKDTFALMNLAAIYFVKKQYDSAIVYADMGLLLNSNNEYLLMKKAAAHEALKQYHSAYVAANRVLQLHPSENIRDYTGYLQNKTFVNQIGITHLQSFFPASEQYASVTGLQYMRRFEKGSVTGKLNYGDRPSGNGIQGGIDIYYTHDSAYYSNLFINASSGNAFPYWQAGYSIFRNFKKGWEGELGLRYTGFDSLHNYTATAAVGKYLNSTWLNLRTYATYNTKNWFHAYQLTARQYLNDKNDYLSFIGGLGNIPDDQGRNYDLNNFSGFTSGSVGIGFQKNFRYRTTLQVFFNYTNFQVASTKRVDQYDVYITLLRNF